MSDTYPVGVRIFNGESGTATGDAIACRGSWKRFQATVHPSGTLTIQGSSGHGDWLTLATFAFGPATYQNTDPWPFVRVNTAGVSGVVMYMAMGE